MIRIALITKFVTIRWHNFTKKWYENKGYVFTKQKDEFLVNAFDLPDGSDVQIDYQCDDCGKIIKNIAWSIYKKGLTEDNKRFCIDCFNLNSNYRQKTRLTRLQNGISFQRWVVENLTEKEANNILGRWDYKLNKYKPDEIGFRPREKYWFKCPKEIHKSELKNIANFVGGHQKTLDCMACNSFGQFLVDNYGIDAIDLYWDYDLNKKVDVWSVAYKSDTKIWIKCSKKNYHGSYKTSCCNFSNGIRCPYCVNRKVHMFDSLGALHPEVLGIWSKKNKKNPYEYAPNCSRSVWWKCPEGRHADYKRIINDSINYQFHCPECTRERNESFLQEKIRLYLNELGFTILHEYNCTIIPKNPKTKYRMPFDNEIKELKLIIEVHGAQHYTISGFHKLQAKKNNITKEEALHYQKLKDRYKKIYAISQGYKYLEIPYWADDDIMTWKKLINDNINKIFNENIPNELQNKLKDVI